MNYRDGAGREIDPYEVPSAKKNRGMDTFPMVLAAGVPKSIGVQGDYIHILTAPVDDLTARFDSGRANRVFQGHGFRRYYDSVEFESATGQTILVQLGFGSVQDARATANVNVTTNIAPGNTVDDGGRVSCVALTATQLLAADTDRLYANITNPSTNTLTMYIGSAGVDDTKGTPLEPGTTLPFPTTGAIFAYNAHAVTAEYLFAASIKEV